MKEKIKICGELAQNSDCNRMRYGAILENKEGAIIGRGFNKKLALPALDLLLDCCKLRDQMKIPHGWRGEFCKAIHAEQAAVQDALNNGYSAEGGIITVCGFYLNGRLSILKEASFYCTLCSRFLFMFGVKAAQVVVGNEKKYSLEKLPIEEIVLRSYESAMGVRSLSGCYDYNKLKLNGCNLKLSNEINPRSLFLFNSLLTRAWSDKTSMDSAGWHPDKPAWGQAPATVLVVQDYFGGEIAMVYVLKQAGGFSHSGYHYYNLLEDGSVLDFTLEQFPESAVFYFGQEEKIRKDVFLANNVDIGRKYKILRQNLKDLRMKFKYFD